MFEPKHVDKQCGRRPQYSLRLLFVGITMGCIVLGTVRAAPSSLVLIVGAAIALILDRVEAKWKAAGMTVKPTWYRVGRRLYFGLSGLVHGAIVGIVVAVVVYNVVSVNVDFVGAAVFSGSLGGAVGAVYPDFVKSICILF